MRIRVALNKTKIKQLLAYSGDFLELGVEGKSALLFVEEGGNYIQTSLDLLYQDEDFQQIRIPKYILNNLKSELAVDIELKDSEISFTFYGAELVYMYKVDVKRQRGVVEYKQFQKLKATLPAFESHNLQKYKSLITTLSILKIDLFCLDGVLYGEFMKGFLFTKADLPNFGISAFNLNKLIAVSDTIVFAGNFLYSENGGVDIFMFKHRVPKSCDLIQCRSQHFSHDVTIDSSVMKDIYSRFSVDNNANILLDCSKAKMSIEDEDKTIDVSVPIGAIKSNLAETLNEDKLLESMLNPNKLNLSKEELENPHKVPIINIPKWVLFNIVRAVKVNIKISKSFVLMSLPSFKVIYPRGYYDRF